MAPLLVNALLLAPLALPAAAVAPGPLDDAVSAVQIGLDPFSDLTKRPKEKSASELKMAWFMRRNAPPTTWTHGRNLSAAWLLFDGKPPGQQLTYAGEEKTVLKNADEPVFYKCGGKHLPSGYPTDYYDGHWTYNVSTPVLLPYVLPKDHPNRTDAAIIIAPGGGGRFLSIDQEGTEVAKWLNSIGVSAFVLKYRTTIFDDKEHAEAFEADMVDTQRAMSLVRSRAQEIGVNASRIGFMGFSYTGTLMAALSVDPRRYYPRLDSIDDVAFRPDFVLGIYPAIRGDQVTGASLTANTPRTFVAMAENDPCVSPDTVAAYYFNLKKGGGPLGEMHMFSHGKHGFGVCSMRPHDEAKESLSFCQWVPLAKAFIGKQVFGMERNAVLAEKEGRRKKYPQWVSELEAAGHFDLK